MKLPSCVLVVVLSLSAVSHAEDSVHVEEFKTAATLRFASEMRKAYKDGYFAKNLSAAEFERLIPIISSDVAACWARGYIRLAKSKQIPIEQVLLANPAILFDTRHFAPGESNEAVGHCAIEAVQRAGIEHDLDAD